MINKENSVDYLKSWVKSHDDINAIELIKADSPKFEVIDFIFELLRGIKTISVVQNDSNFQIVDADGNSLYEINAKGETFLDLDFSHEITVLLAAIRIHEVESLDWVWLTPEIRDESVNTFLSSHKIEKDEYRRAKALWLSII